MCNDRVWDGLENIKQGLQARDLSPFLRKTEAELQQLHTYVNALNKDHWPAIVDADEYRKRQPMYEPELPITEALS